MRWSNEIKLQHVDSCNKPFFYRAEESLLRRSDDKNAANQTSPDTRPTIRRYYREVQCNNRSCRRGIARCASRSRAQKAAESARRIDRCVERTLSSREALSNEKRARYIGLNKDSTRRTADTLPLRARASIRTGRGRRKPEESRAIMPRGKKRSSRKDVVSNGARGRRREGGGGRGAQKMEKGLPSDAAGRARSAGLGIPRF